MNCPRVEGLLPLYSSDDLPASQMNAVRAHLADCAPCQQRAIELAESRSWLQGYAPPQFDAAFFAELRVAVRREIAADKAAPDLAEALWQWLTPRWRPLLAGVLLLLLGGLLFSRNFNHRKGTVQTDIAQYNDKQKQPDSQAQKIIGQTNQLAGALTPKHFVRKARLAKAGNKQRGWRPLIAASANQNQASAPDRVAGNAATGAEISVAKDDVTAMPEMLRIELQTADPNIRIIWFTPKQDATLNTR